MSCKEGSGFFANRACEYFPCHEGIDLEEFNCLFCFCPLYALGEGCGGDFCYTESGVKNCDRCSLPHMGEAGGAMVAEHFKDLADLASR